MKNVYDFLTGIRTHNNKEWFHDHPELYQAARQEFKEFVMQLISGIASFDASIAGLEPKQCIFRINRDVRFSKNKDPYKTNMGAAMAQGGKNSGDPLYYIHLEPGKSFLAGGVYMPDAAMLAKIRQEIDYNSGQLHKILAEPDFQSFFGAIDGDKLKTAPKGYAKDHPEIKLLVFKSYTVIHQLDDTVFTGEHVVNGLLEKYRVMYPFNRFLAQAMS